MELVCMLSNVTYVPCLQEQDQRGRNVAFTDTDLLPRGSNELKQNSFKRLLCQETNTDKADSLVTVLKSCSEHGNLNTGVLLHADIVRGGLIENDPFVGTALVNMYAKCGALGDAQRVFNELPCLNVIAWNTILTAFIRNGHIEQALGCFEQMQSFGLLPDSISYVCVLNICGSIGASDMGQKIHAQIVRERILDRNIILANSLINMYAKCGLLENAREVLDKLPVRSVISWTALIAGYAKYGFGMEALTCYEQMQHEGFSPTPVTIVCIVKACGSVGALEKGQEFHAKSVRNGLLETNNLVVNALIDMYIKCHMIQMAEELFHAVSLKDVVSWTSLISGLTEHGHSREALQYFDQMISEGCAPNAITYGCSLKACSSIGAIEKGQQLHRQILGHTLCDQENHLIGIALVDMYAKCGAFPMAHSVFDELHDKDVVLWNALISGYIQDGGYSDKVLDMFEQMHASRVIPDEVTHSCTLKACSALGASVKGQGLHAEITKVGFLENGSVLGNALSDMYANCGMPAEAQAVFMSLLNQDVASWNTLIAGYAYLGKQNVAFDIFENMKGSGNEPNLSTFSVLLSTFSHRGSLNEGQMFLERMVESYNVMPSEEHLTCLVDLFSRAGCLDMAATIIDRMHFSADFLLCHSIFKDSQQWGSLNLGSWAFEHLAHMEGEISVPMYV